MDNQHRLISGYRELSQAEIALINRVKAQGEELRSLIHDVEIHLQNLPPPDAGAGETSPTTMTDPTRFVGLARDDLQTGLMLLTRAVARPTFF